MTLYLRQVAVCDGCNFKWIFEESNPNACRSALAAMGWRHVIRDKGRELLCAKCVERYSSDELARMTARAGGIRPEVKLARGRNRPGAFIDPVCGALVPFADAFYEPFTKEHPLNLRCLECCVRRAAIRGYRVDVRKYLPGEVIDPPLVPKETQQALFT